MRNVCDLEYERIVLFACIRCSSCDTVLQVFSSIYREFKRRWKLASSSLFLYQSWFDTNDPLPDLRIVIWKQIQIHSSKYGKVYALVAVILVVYRRHCAELVVAGTGVDIVVVLFVHCTLSTLSSVWRIFASDESASDELASDDVIFRSSFFRRILTLIFQERFHSDVL